MRNLLSSLCLAAALLSGCTSVRDARGPSEICEVHHTFMRSVQVPGPRGELQVTPEYVAALARLFPHAYLDSSTDSRNTWVIYVCEDCVRAKAEWLKQHPEQKPR